ncbi:hypothetical protein [Streptomyces monashensis]|uniref:Secreted protein n=1 Tax=Streptomyces monashensis TaxID=1678012 RepID=A0A1S2P0H4_9ACTN|nr:hypothetical protein [Streptomyces monashensis]OIJ86634.1 hypothetical protein BIV23_43870 [Streptomyces monashensis]
MRGLHARRLASTVLCAAVLVAVAGPAAVAADSGGTSPQGASASPVPGAEKLLTQIRTLDNTGSVLQPVIDLLKESLTKGKLEPAEAHRLADAAKKAIAEAKRTQVSQAAGTASAAQSDAATSTAATAVPATPAAPAPAKHGRTGAPATARDATDDALNSLLGDVEKVLQGVLSVPAALLPAATSTVGDLVKAVTGLLGGVLGAVAPAAGPESSSVPAAG